MPIVKFVHPGQEVLPKAGMSIEQGIFDDERETRGIRYWNNEQHHCRKYLISKGKHRSSAEEEDSEGFLTFWGEWEPQSRFKKLDAPTNRHPKYLHKPFLLKGSTGRHNTDPFVFGKRFWYTNCHQENYRFLRGLPIGSMILFGTQYNNRFALDTVFVVKDGYSPYQYIVKHKRDPAIFPEQLQIATLDHGDMAANHLQLGDLRFYRGKSPCDGAPFSFVPCGPSGAYEEAGEREEGHARIELDCAAFGLPENSEGCAQVRNQDVLNLWK